MIKLKLQPAPTFEATVDIPVHGGGSVPVKFQFKHRTRDEMQEWLATVTGDNKAKSRSKKKREAEFILEMVAGWELDDELSIENAALLDQNYAGAGRAIFEKYIDELAQARTKN